MALLTSLLMNQWVRLRKIDLRIRAGEYPSAQSLAQEFDVTPRVIFKDRLKLVTMGASIAFDKRRGGWYYQNATWSLPAVQLSEGELIAFFLSVEIARSCSNGALQETLLSAVQKISQSLGEVVSVDLNALLRGTSYAFSPAARVDILLHEKLCQAAANRSKVHIRYYTASRGVWTERVVHPYHLHWARGEWILIAWDQSKATLRCFNIARISRLDVLQEHFLQQSDFDAPEFLRTMFFAETGDEVFEVVVRFDEYQARYIREREWHPEQQVIEQPEGTLILRFPAAGLQEVARWVLGYGQHVQVLEPPQLKKLIWSHLSNMLPVYQPEAQLQA